MRWLVVAWLAAGCGGAAKPIEQPVSSVPGREVDDTSLDDDMAAANRAYDGHDFDEAKRLARKVLARSPANVRMLRLLVSASCLTEDAETARAYHAKLQQPDRAAMKQRCARYNVDLPD